MRRWIWSLLLLVAMPIASFLLVWAWPDASPAVSDGAARSSTSLEAHPPPRPGQRDAADPGGLPLAEPARQLPTAATAADPEPTPSYQPAAATGPAAPPLPALDDEELAALRELHAGQRDAFDAALSDWQAGQPAQAGAIPPVEPPSLPAPAASAEPGSLAVSWDEYDSVIEISDAAPDAEGRRLATVTTFDRQGKELVNYQARAYRSADGKLVIDARGAETAGPWARFWSPDSFTVDDQLQVTTIDDLHRSSDGSGAPADGG